MISLWKWWLTGTARLHDIGKCLISYKQNRNEQNTQIKQMINDNGKHSLNAACVCVCVRAKDECTIVILIEYFIIVLVRSTTACVASMMHHAIEIVSGKIPCMLKITKRYIKYADNGSDDGFDGVDSNSFALASIFLSCLSVRVHLCICVCLPASLCVYASAIFFFQFLMINCDII